MNAIKQKIQETEKEIEGIKLRYDNKKKEHGYTEKEMEKELREITILGDILKATLLTLKFAEDLEKEKFEKLRTYLDCDWRNYSKETRRVVKDIQSKIKEVFE